MLSDQVITTFWQNVRKTDTCWLWTGKTNNKGYGDYGARKAGRRAHQVSYVLHKGPIPPGKHVCHTCDVRNCVNPDHLFLSDNLGNVIDKVQKGRQAQGTLIAQHTQGQQNGQAKLQDSQVLEIRSRYAQGGVTQQALADTYGVNKATIGDIVTGRRWKHLGGPVTRKNKKYLLTEIDITTVLSLRRQGTSTRSIAEKTDLPRHIVVKIIQEYFNEFAS